MTLDLMQAKLNDIRRKREQAAANFNAICGAEQILMQLIAEEKAQTAPKGADTDGGQP